MHTCTPALVPDEPGPPALLLSASCLSPSPTPSALFLPTLSAPKVQQLTAVLCFSILGDTGRQRRRKHICELDVPWMFNQERQDCRAQGRIGRCGLPRPLSCCCFRLSCTSCFCQPCPPARVLGLVGSSEWPKPGLLLGQQAAMPLPLCHQHFLGWTSQRPGPALRVPRLSGQLEGTRPCLVEGPLCHIPCTPRARCMLRSPVPTVPALQTLRSTVKCIFIGADS